MIITGMLIRAVFKWLSNVITWLRLLRFVIGLKHSRQFFNQWEAKPKPFAPRTRDFSRASSELQVIARDCDWFMALFIPVVIGWSHCFGFGFSIVIWKPLYKRLRDSDLGVPTTTRTTQTSPVTMILTSRVGTHLVCLYVLILSGALALRLIRSHQLLCLLSAFWSWVPLIGTTLILCVASSFWNVAQLVYDFTKPKPLVTLYTFQLFLFQRDVSIWCLTIIDNLSLSPWDCFFVCFGVGFYS